MKHEAHFTIMFRHWLKANLFISAAFELKVVPKQSMGFGLVKPHQIDALLAVKHRNLLYKAPDDSMGMKPFDLFYLSNAPAYVVIKYPSHFCLIDIDVFIRERDTSKRKSLTTERARDIAFISVDL